jgi:hypothetical protein
VSRQQGRLLWYWQVMQMREGTFIMSHGRPVSPEGGRSGRRFGPVLEYRKDIARFNGVTGQLPRFGGRRTVSKGE